MSTEEVKSLVKVKATEKVELAEQVKKEIRASYKGMQRISITSKDSKERFYYYGQMDGILGLLDKLGIDYNFIFEEKKNG